MIYFENNSLIKFSVSSYISEEKRLNQKGMLKFVDRLLAIVSSDHQTLLSKKRSFKMMGKNDNYFYHIRPNKIYLSIKKTGLLLK